MSCQWTLNPAEHSSFVDIGCIRCPPWFGQPGQQDFVEAAGVKARLVRDVRAASIDPVAGVGCQRRQSLANARSSHSALRRYLHRGGCLQVIGQHHSAWVWSSEISLGHSVPSSPIPATLFSLQYSLYQYHFLSPDDHGHFLYSKSQILFCHVKSSNFWCIWS